MYFDGKNSVLSLNRALRLWDVGGRLCSFLKYAYTAAQGVLADGTIGTAMKNKAKTHLSNLCHDFYNRNNIYLEPFWQLKSF